MTRAMALLFALGATCFLVAPFPGFAGLVGETADAATFFAGSLFFTAGGALQVWGAAGGPRTAWWAAVTQSAGTVFFNASTWRALHTALTDPAYDRLVWRPDALGSICFLVSGVLGYRAAAGRGWQPVVNLAGCVLFAIAAVAGYVVPSTGSVLQLAAANWSTAAGAACFLACALASELERSRAQHPTASRRARHA